MKPARQSILGRNAVALVLLAALIFQVEQVFACAWMDGRVQSHCCCDAGRMTACATTDGCDALPAGSEPCCKVFYRITAQSAMDSDSATGDLALAYAPLLLPVVWLAVTLIAFPPAQPRLDRHPQLRITWNAGTATYLTTQRLRD